MSPENYASVLQYVSSSLPPFLQNDGKPSLPPSTWLAAFSDILLIQQVFGGREKVLADTQKNRLLCDVLGKQGELQLDLGMDGVHHPFDATPHAMFVQAVCTCLQDLVASHDTTATSSLLSGTAEPQPTGVVSFQAGTRCEHSWKCTSAGKMGDALKGKDQGHGLGSHESGGYACPVLLTGCSCCHRDEHTEGVCEVKRVVQEATPGSSSVPPRCAAPCDKSTCTLQSLQSTPATVPTDSFTNALTPQTTVYSRGPEGDDPKGELQDAEKGSDCINPSWVALQSSLLQDAEKGSDCINPSWVASQSSLPAAMDPHASLGCPATMSIAQGGTRTPACTGSVSVVVPVGGLEWLVGPLGIPTNIPPPTSGGPAYGPGLGAHEQCTPSAGLHVLSVGTSTVTEDTSSILQQLDQVPSVTGTLPLQAVSTVPLHELSTSALDSSSHTVQPPCNSSCSPGLSPGTAPDALNLRYGERTSHSDPTSPALQECVNGTEQGLEEQGATELVDRYPLVAVETVTPQRATDTVPDWGLLPAVGGLVTRHAHASDTGSMSMEAVEGASTYTVPVASPHSCTTYTASLMEAENLLGDFADGDTSWPHSGSCYTTQVSSSNTGESPHLQFRPTCAVLDNSWLNPDGLLTRGHGGQGVTAAGSGDECTDREHCCHSMKTSTVIPSTGLEHFPLPTWPTSMAESRELPLYDVNSVLMPCLDAQMSSSNWLAASRFSLSPGQVGWGTVLPVSWRDDLLSDSWGEQDGHMQFCNSWWLFSGCPSPFDVNSCDSTPLVLSGLLLQLHNCREVDTRGSLLQGIGGNLGGCQFWPFDPRTLRYTIQQPSGSLQLSPIWQATYSLSLLPGQHGNAWSKDLSSVLVPGLSAFPRLLHWGFLHD